MKSTTAYAFAWIATALAVIAGILITKESGCLWAMFIPALISVKNKSDEESDEEETT